MDKEILNIQRLIDRKIKEITDRPVVIAIDGRAAAGKTTLAGRLAEIYNGGVVHMDDFFLPVELRTEKRLKEPGGNVHYERFIEEVIPYLRDENEFSYRRFDCSKMAPGENVTVKKGNIRIVEGAYSQHPILGNYMDIRVFCDIAGDKQMERIILRNGAQKAEIFKNRWIIMEEAYHSCYKTRENSDIAVFID